MHYIKTRMYDATYVNKNVKMVCNLAKKDINQIKKNYFVILSQERATYVNKNVKRLLCSIFWYTIVCNLAREKTN